MLGWLKKKSIEKQQANISIILNNLVPICAELDRLIELSGRPVTEGEDFLLLQSQRRELRFQLNGPMEMMEVRQYVEPFLVADGVPESVRLAVESVIDQYQEETGRS